MLFSASLGNKPITLALLMPRSTGTPAFFNKAIGSQRLQLCLADSLPMLVN